MSSYEYIVLAGNKRQFDQMNKNPLHRYFYVDRPDKARGLRVDDVLIIGTFWEDVKETSDLYREAKSRII